MSSSRLIFSINVNKIFFSFCFQNYSHMELGILKLTSVFLIGKCRLFKMTSHFLHLTFSISLSPSHFLHLTFSISLSLRAGSFKFMPSLTECEGHLVWMKVIYVKCTKIFGFISYFLVEHHHGFFSDKKYQYIHFLNYCLY